MTSPVAITRDVPARLAPSSARALVVEWFVVAVAFVFLLAGYEKLLGASDLTPVIAWLGIPNTWGSAITVATGALELLLGGLLAVVRMSRTWLLAIVILILAAYSGLLLRLALGDAAPSCGCLAIMSQMESARLENAVGVLRNLLLATPCIAALYMKWAN